MLDQPAVHFSAEFELLQRNPFVVRVGLGDAAGTEDDQVLQSRQHDAVGAVRHGLDLVLPGQTQHLLNVR